MFILYLCVMSRCVNGLFNLGCPTTRDLSHELGLVLSPQGDNKNDYVLNIYIVNKSQLSLSLINICHSPCVKPTQSE